MNVELLISTMNQVDFSLIEKMNIQSDAIIINQHNHVSYMETKINNFKVRMFTYDERGIGKSRNSAILRSTADICIFVDDDECMVDNYVELVLGAFAKVEKADAIIFNLTNLDHTRDKKKIQKVQKIGFLNYMRYGAPNIAIRRASINCKNIFFSLEFGGGAKYSHGEDTIFLNDCIKNKLKIYGYPEVIGILSENKSTWFTGYDAKYFVDHGELFRMISGKFSCLLSLQLVLRRGKRMCSDIGRVRAFQLMTRRH